MIVTCRKCGEQKEKSSQTGSICADCYKAYLAEYRAKNYETLTAKAREKHARKRQTDSDWVELERKRGRDYWQQIRYEAIMAYGGYKCACCGETEPKFLTIDHIFNNGAEHRRELGGADGNGKGYSNRVLVWAKQHGYPAGFQVLCMKCNFGKSVNGGICPHKAGHSANRVNSGNVQTG